MPDMEQDREDCLKKTITQVDTMESPKKKLVKALVILLAYAVTYLLGRIFFTEQGDYTLEQWLWGDWKQLDYLYGWLLDKGWFLYATVFCVLMVLKGKERLSWWIWVGFTAGMLLGEPVGATPVNSYYHYGWRVWMSFVLISIVAGLVTEKIYKNHGTCRHQSFLYVMTAAVIVYGWVIMNTILTVQQI